MNLNNLDTIAKEISEYWKNNCTDEEFYKNCMNSICEYIGFNSGIIPQEAYEIWDIIEKNYL